MDTDRKRQRSGAGRSGPRKTKKALREVQAFFATVASADVLLSEELICDRREEAAREGSLSFPTAHTCAGAADGIGVFSPRAENGSRARLCGNDGGECEHIQA